MPLIRVQIEAQSALFVPVCQGRWEEATAEKLRLLAQQKQQKKSGSSASPVWFRQAEDDSWRFTGEYWTSRDTQDWSRSPEIF